MKRTLMLLCMMFILSTPLFALSDSAMTSLSMERSERIYAVDPVIGKILPSPGIDVEILDMIDEFFLEDSSVDDKVALFLEETALMARTLYGKELFSLLPAEDIRLGVPIESEGLRVPFRLFLDDHGEYETVTGMVFLLRKDGEWRLAHIEIEIS